MEKIDFAAISADVARQLLGEPNRRLSGRHELRFGNKGAIALDPRAGTFFDHEAQEGGGVLAMIQHVEGGDPWQWLADRGFIEDRGVLDYTAPDPIEVQRRAAERDAERRKRDAQAEAEEKRKRELAARIWREAMPIEGTPAETYLRGRAITSWPEDCARWHPAAPSYPGDPAPRAAIVFPFTDALGDVVAVMAVRLTHEGRKISDKIAKKTLGPMRKGMCILPGDGPLHLAEGPETGLSVWLATGAPVMVCGTAISARHVEQAPAGPLVLCSDAAPDGAAVAKALAGATGAAVARGLPCAVAVPDGPDKTDWNDLLQAHGAKAVADAIAQATPTEAPRDATGRFTGAGAIEADPIPAPEFMSLQDAQEAIAKAVQDALSDASQWDAESGDPAPMVAIKATPGAGKSVGLRRGFQGFDPAKRGGDAVYYSPTMALSDQAARDAEALGLGFHVTRGRTALNPETGQPMCARADEAEELGRLGVPVKPNLCRRDNGDGTLSLCPFYAVCAGLETPEDGEPAPAYLRQWDSLPDKPVLRFEAHAYLNPRGDGSDRPIGLRIVDEKSWNGALRHASVRADAWTRADTTNLHGLPGNIAAMIKAKREADAADRVAIAQRVLNALQAGESPVLADVSAEEFEQFAKDDAATLPTQLMAGPAASAEKRSREIEALAALEREGGKRAAVWKVLAEAKRAGIEYPERLEWLPDWKGPKGDREPRDVIRVHWMAEMPTDAPVILLDADADPVMIEQLHPQARLVDIAVKPQAEVIQVADRTFSKASLIGPEKRGNRNAWADVIRAEVIRDKADPIGARGVLAGGSKAVVRAMFEDAGLIAPDTPSAEADHIMKATELHGARWLWFGPGSLGLNSFQEFGTVVVIGREELPLDVLEAIGRAMFGDSGEPLQMVQPDATGRALMPLQPVPYLMADGSGAAGQVRVHPDPRIAAIQAQSREAGTRQLIERLRLVRAGDRPKRVILGSNVPLPGLPVAKLVRFEELRPGRFERACMSAAQRGGVLRLSAAGLAEDAPDVFRTVREAEGWLERGGREAIKYPRAPNNSSITGAGVLNGVRVDLRMKGQRGRATPALVFGSGDPRAIAEAKLGELAAFELIDLDTARPARRLVILPDAEQIDSPIVADHVARRGVKREPGPGVPLVPDLPFPHRSWWIMIADYPFLIWARDAVKARDAPELVPI